MADQKEWRYCNNCHGLFFDGYPDKGRCPAGGGHIAIGYNFVLPHDVGPTPNQQDAWRYCNNCHGLFFDGYPDKGRCPAGGGHIAIGYNFVLPHDIGATPNRQDAWRYCNNCHGLFFDGYPDKGRCPSGGGHIAIGYDFVLPHPVTPAISLQAIQRDDGRFIEVHGTGFTPNSKVTLSYDITAGGGPTTHQFGDHTAETTTSGALTDDIKVNFPDTSGASVGALDQITGTRVSASI